MDQGHHATSSPPIDAPGVEPFGVHKDEPIVGEGSRGRTSPDETSQSELPSEDGSGQEDGTSEATSSQHPPASLTNSQPAPDSAQEVVALADGISTTTPPTPPSKPAPPTPAKESLDTTWSSVPAVPTQVLRTNGHTDGRPQTPNTPPPHPIHKRSLTISKGHTVSVILISSALETILSSKEAKRSPPLRESAQKALDMIRAGQGGDRPRDIFEPLRLACETRNEKLMIASLDCISKLISYSFFAEEPPAHSLPSPPPSPALQGRQSMSGSQTNIPQPSLVDFVVHTITTCHSETTPETVSLQVVKALLALILSPTIYVHHSSLLKAVRTVYNIFLLSTDPVNQMVAQGGLTQMVHHVFMRCRTTPESDEGTTLRSSVSSDTLASSVHSHHNGTMQADSRRSSLVPIPLISDSAPGKEPPSDANLADEGTASAPSNQGSAQSPGEQVAPPPPLIGYEHGSER
jgi:brefeldin A-inhibited guanine nucleotide-exchange protein